jgi:hypothetical protein
MTATMPNPLVFSGATTSLLPLLRELKNAEKLFLIQFLAGELSREEQSFPMSPLETYYVWSPYDSVEAAQGLLEFIQNNTEQTLTN